MQYVQYGATLRDGAVTLGLGLHTTVRQDLRINPRLYQAMDLLYMPLLALQQYLKQELLGNPFLELVEPDEDNEVTVPEEGAEPKPATDDGPDWEDLLLDRGLELAAPARDMSEAPQYLDRVPVGISGLIDYLREQLRLLDLTHRQELLAEELLGNIADDGYLGATFQEIVDGANRLLADHAAALSDDAAGGRVPPYTLAEAQELLGIVQQLDPPGVGARDLRECLLLQLAEKRLTGTLAYRLARDGWDDLRWHRWSDLGKRFGLEPGEVQRAADDLAKLDPKPGLQRAAASEVYITTDLIIEEVEGQYRVSLNDAGVPRLRIAQAYRELARDRKQFRGENKEFVTQRLNSAHWMIQAIEQRRQTILKVMNAIIARQRNFFERGVEWLKPLTLREVADEIGMHESTVSRVVNEKYVQTPRGLLPLRFFFSSGLATTTGQDASARAIKAQTARLVAREDLKHPLTDQQLVELLERDGVQIARRTVAKYRGQLGILPARMRKRV